MKKLWMILAAMAAILPWSAAAQVEKQVEVTKAYVPSVEGAQKKAVIPDMIDTVRMQPEIDYSITPLSLRTTLTTKPIRPATVTYWEFNRPLPFYVKAGAGYPLNSVLDFYASSQNPSTGYVLGYVNHEGRYAKITNDFGVKNNSTRMMNRIGAAAGKYLGRHILEGELSYENRLYHRYGGYSESPSDVVYRPGAKVGYGDANVAVRFGDDFSDLSRVNFELGLGGGIFMDAPEMYGANADGEWGRHDQKSRQTSLDAHARIAKAFGRHRLLFEAGYERWAGQKTISDYNQQQAHVAVRYGIDGDVVRLEVGGDYYYDRVKTAQEAGNYLIPFLRFDFNLGTAAMKPFAEIDGGVYNNGYKALSQLNPYLTAGQWLDKSSVDYNGRFGIRGTFAHERFAYRLYAGFTIHDNRLFWYGRGGYDTANAAIESLEPVLLPEQARQTVTSFNGEIDYRPMTSLSFSLGVHGYLYNDDLRLGNGSPAFAGNMAVRYVGRKITVGASVQLQSERKWSFQNAANEEFCATFEAPFAADLRLEFEWRVSGRVALFAEGRNLIDQPLYEQPWFPEYRANCVAGVKIAF